MASTPAVAARPPKPVTGSVPQAYLDEALCQQGLTTAPPGALKQKWTEGGYDYEVRVHPANPTHGKSGSIYRVGRRSKAVDEFGQGSGWEFMDRDGAWHAEKTLKPGKPGSPNSSYNETAAEATHISLEPDEPPPNEPNPAAP